MKRGKTFGFSVEPYHYEVIVFYCITPRTLKTRLTKLGVDNAVIDPNCSWQTFEFVETNGARWGAVYIAEKFRWEPEYVGFVAHEAFHVSHNICCAVGVKVKGSNDEPVAYLVQHITQKILEGVQ